jgi:hypothetical protein
MEAITVIYLLILTLIGAKSIPAQGSKDERYRIELEFIAID